MKTNKALLAVIFFFLTFCHEAQAKTLKESRNVYLAPSPNFETMSSFKKLLRAHPGTFMYERARIDYLLERLSHSSYEFIRNGISYDGLQAAKHLKMKMFRHYKEGKDAEYFVDYIANSSRKSGEKYLVRVGHKDLYATQTLFHNELRLLNEGLRKFNVENAAIPKTDSFTKPLKGLSKPADYSANKTSS